MEEIEITIKVTVLEREHLPVSSFLKTILHTVDVAVENRDPLNQFKYTITNAHPDAQTNTELGEHPLRKTIGL